METERERNIRRIYEALGVERWEPPKPVVIVKKKKKREAPIAGRASRKDPVQVGGKRKRK